MKYGYVKPEIKEEDYRFGDAMIAADILQPNGQWDAYLPPDEFQNRGFEPYACATFSTFNAVETILRRRYTQIEDYSDRYTATITGTAAKHGNDPHLIAETIRKLGAAFEKDWPYDKTVTTFEQFYATPPTYLSAFAEAFSDEFVFQHDYVPTVPLKLKEALKFSPLGVSVYAWEQGADGMYVKPDGASDNHWVLLYGYVNGQYWKIFDTYDNSHKKLRWDFYFEVAKRYHVTRTASSQAQLRGWQLALQKALIFLNNLIHGKTA